jgi:hypothetical protein
MKTNISFKLLPKHLKTDLYSTISHNYFNTKPPNYITNENTNYINKILKPIDSNIRHAINPIIYQEIYLNTYREVFTALK